MDLHKFQRSQLSELGNTDFESWAKAGDVGVVPSGHDAWVVGDEPVVVIDISGMKQYAKPATKKVVKKTGKAKAGKKRR